MKNMHYRKYFITISILFSVLFLASEGVRAAPIVEFFNTGVDINGNVLPAGLAEQHYSMSYNKIGDLPLPASAFVVSAWTTWVDPPAGSAWIGPENGNITGPDGIYTYELTFDLAGLDYINFVMSGLWATDNTAAMKLNSNDTGIRTTLGAPFQSLQSFTIGNGFMPGINKLEFVVTNISLGASGNNPTGLLVADLQGTIVPIPGAVWLFCSGLICLVGLKRRLRFGERSL